MKTGRPHIHEIILFSGLLIAVISLPYSITVCHAGILLILLNWIVQWNWKEKLKLAKQNLSVLFFVAFFIIHLIGMSYSYDFENALFNVEKKFSLLVVPVILATSYISLNNKFLLYKSFIATCLMACLICLGGSTYRVTEGIDSSHLNFGLNQPELLVSNPFFSNQWQEFSYVTLSSSIGIHPTYFSIYLLLCLAILIIHYNHRFIHQFISIGLILFFTSFLALLSTRISIVIILALIAILSAYSIIKLSKSWFKNLAIGAGLIILFFSLSALNPVSLYREFQELKSTPLYIDENTHYTNSTDIRLSLWWIGIKTAMQSNPLIGSGTGSTEANMIATANTHRISNVLNTNDPHNQYLNTYISLGITGLILLLGCYLIRVNAACRPRDLTHITFIGIILIASFTESFLELQKGIVFFALFQSLFTFRNYQSEGVTKLSSL